MQAPSFGDETLATSSQEGNIISYQGPDFRFSNDVREENALESITSALSLKGEGRGEGALNDVDGILPIAKSNLALSHWSQWQLPGHGVAYDDCGSLGWKGCLDVAAHAKTRPDGISYAGKIFVKKYKRNCGRGQCPVCYESWASKEAHRAERRLRAFKPNQFRKVIHIVVSPSQEDIDLLYYRDLRSRAYSVLKKVGVYGGIVIIHPFRERENGSWYLSPHFHVLGYGWVSNVGDTYQETGYIVKNLGVRKSVYATLVYQLSHAGVYMKAEGEKGKKSTITWFGALSYNKFKAPEEEEREVCPICEQKLVPIRYIGEGDPPLINLDNLSQNEGEFFIEFVIGKLQWEEVCYYGN